MKPFRDLCFLVLRLCQEVARVVPLLMSRWTLSLLWTNYSFFRFSTTALVDAKQDFSQRYIQGHVLNAPPATV